MQFPNSVDELRQEATKLAKAFLNENPTLMQRYVEFGMVAVDSVLNPLNDFMRHLIKVQNLNPDATPGVRDFLAPQDALSKSFDQKHDKDYDSDYNFSWVHKKWEELNKLRSNPKLSQLSEKEFTELTDISRLPNTGVTSQPFTIDRGGPITEEENFFSRTTEINRIAPESKKKEIPLEEKQERENKREKKIKELAKEIRNQAEVVKTKKKANKTTAKKPTKVTRRLSKSEGFIPFTVPSTRFSNEKLEKARKLADEMVARNLVDSSPKNLEAQIKEIAGWTDEAFDAVERTLDIHSGRRTPRSRFNGAFKRAPVVKTDNKKIQKEAKAIQDLIDAGRLDPKDLPDLIYEGLDSKVVEAWEKLFKKTY